ncbi:aminopeptidase P N-terminal domain-containing protein [Pseudotenacibaculum sp. MALMAid0570]|uniref:aminopeptidase P N-terminal domain-containing protein n=1 Tax=Pseudotenacibaculum sp. MALMAid0570 TaxID=3143938 RepID=UPI0032DFC1AD
MKKLFSSLFMLAFIALGVAQDGTPTDYLSKEFHKSRRDLLRSKMPKNSVAVVFANPVRNRANDVDYVYHQDPNFYYLTGYREPNAVLVIFSDDQTDENGNNYNEVIYVQQRNARAEMWNGRRLGTEGAKKQLGFSKAYNGIDFVNSKINFKEFDKVFIDGKFKDDYRNLGGGTDIYDLVVSFKEKSGYNPDSYISNVKKYFYSQIKETPVENRANVISVIKRYENQYTELKKDAIIQGYINAADEKLAKEMQQKVALAMKPKTNVDLDFMGAALADMREIKTEEEIKLLTKAIRISAVGQIEVMKAMKPHMSETELQGIHEFVYKKYGAEYEGYPSIVGAGNNGCILHYIENNKTKVGNDLVLMDLGAEYRGYTADVTRTIPANGKFTPEQKAIYDIVYKAQEAGIKASVVGAGFNAPNMASKAEINKGLLALGIIKSIDERHNYLPHGVSHYLGLDVHDPGTYSKFRPNTVITVEPGIYIPEGSPCDKKWWGIAVRIEDDILITEKGPVNLSAEAPRTSDAIEKMMAKPSVLDAFLLPDLDK